jgi:demethylmenaquinone methyltransferase/2-methoxy-6-polyprenyl-1,4-benzoquinol methylase
MIEGKSRSADSSKAQKVRSMFAEIAPRYDFLNHALSLNIDRRWRRSAARALEPALEGKRGIVLDLCCGTADLSIEISRSATVIGLDFCRQMLSIGQDKVGAAGRPVYLIEADAMQTPFASESFDAVTIAFGLRNLNDVEQGLQEINRVLKPGGRTAILEFSRPTLPVIKQVYRFYFSRLLPFIGNTISGSSFAYRYLPDSVQEFPEPAALKSLLCSVGFSRVGYYNLSGGIAVLHVADKK